MNIRLYHIRFIFCEYIRIFGADCDSVAKFTTNASGAMLLPNLVQVTESISGYVVSLAMFIW